MVFSSHAFLFYFLPLTLALYYAVPRRGRHAVLAVLSYAFYGWANPLFVFLLLGSTVVDYFCGLAIAGRGAGWAARIVGRADLVRAWTSPPQRLPDGMRTARQRVALGVSICVNLSLLGFFKYFNFGVDNWNATVAALGLETLRMDTVLRVTLPLGISFYTFQSMSYTIDVYRGRSAALQSFVDFACYVSLFPQLVAGPIVRFSEIADQLAGRRHDVARFARGAAFVSVGLAKKVLLANPCGRVADLAFDAGAIGAIEAWYGAAAYAFQIYFDFSGYSDMAIGLGLMLGFVFPKNFDSPYHAGSVTEFWRRWHISLSAWLRDYLYIPLGGSRSGALRTYANLALVMLLGGLWHGAAWNFVVWGGLHGTLLAAERARGGPIFHAAPRPLRVAATFATLLVTWVFFRADSLSGALRYLESMAGLGDPPASADVLRGLLYEPYSLATVGCAALVTWGAPQTWDWSRRLTGWRAGAAAALFVVSAAILATQAYNPFIYFIF